MYFESTIFCVKINSGLYIIWAIWWEVTCVIMC